jgi:hypothetical protein
MAGLDGHLMLPLIRVIEYILKVDQVTSLDVAELVRAELGVTDSTTRPCVRASVEALTVREGDHVSRQSPVLYADLSQFTVAGQ